MDPSANRPFYCFCKACEKITPLPKLIKPKPIIKDISKTI